MLARAGMVRHTNQVKPSHKSVPPTVRYPRRVPTLLVSVWFRLRERTILKAPEGVVSPSWWLRPHGGPRRYGTAHEPGKTKPEIGAAYGTLPEAHAHAVGVRVVTIERENQCEKRQKVLCHRHGG